MGLTVGILVMLFISALVLLVVLALPDKWLFVLPKLALVVCILGILGYMLPIMLVAVSWYASGGNIAHMDG